MALLTARLAWAGPTEKRDREAAKAATKQATAAYNLGHYDEATSLYEEAYRLVPDPILLYDLGQSYRQANKLDKALTAYRSYLRTAPRDAPKREQVERWVREIELTSELQTKTAAQKAAEEKQPLAPAVPPLAVPKPPEPQAAREQVSPPKSAQEKEPLAPVVPAPAPESVPGVNGQAGSVPGGANQGWWLGRKWTWIAAGSTVLLAAGAVVADLAMYSKIGSSKSYPCGQNQYCYSTSDASSINSRMIAAEVLGGLAAAAVLTTGLLFYFEGRPVSVTPAVGGMTGALARVAF